MTADQKQKIETTIHLIQDSITSEDFSPHLLGRALIILRLLHSESNHNPFEKHWQDGLTS